jgi:L-iditol 2-dehydrogenase
MTIAIWGAGPAGTLLAKLSRARGLIPYVIEPDPQRREKIRGCEAPGDERFDACICAVGAAAAYREALKCLGPRGRLVVFSGLAPADEQITVNFNHLHYHEQTIVGAYGCSYRHGEEALRLLAGRKVEVGDMITHRFSLDEIDTALTVVEKREGMKVLLFP